jgi:hypothetical protein
MHLQAQKHERFGNPRCTTGIHSIPDDDKQSNDPNPGALEQEPIEWQRCDKIHCKSAQKCCIQTESTGHCAYSLRFEARESS